MSTLHLLRYAHPVELARVPIPAQAEIKEKTGQELDLLLVWQTLRSHTRNWEEIGKEEEKTSQLLLEFLQKAGVSLEPPEEQPDAAERQAVAEMKMKARAAAQRIRILQLKKQAA